MISKENENPKCKESTRPDIEGNDRAVEEEAVQEQLVETRSLVQPGECSGVRDRILCMQQAGVSVFEQTYVRGS
jgi:hypothetical protein